MVITLQLPSLCVPLSNNRRRMWFAWAMLLIVCTLAATSSASWLHSGKELRKKINI